MVGEMKTLQQQETEAILSMADAHENQRETIFRMGQRIEELEEQLRKANIEILSLIDEAKHK
jgi:hypothetical protein